MISLNEWPIGGVQEPHLDTYSNQEQSAGTETNYPARQWTTILYLNDNYRGGRTYVPDDQVYEPVTGAISYSKAFISGMVYRKSEDTQDIQSHFGSQKNRQNKCHSSLWMISI